MVQWYNGTFQCFQGKTQVSKRKLFSVFAFFSGEVWWNEFFALSLQVETKYPNCLNG